MQCGIEDFAFFFGRANTVSKLGVGAIDEQVQRRGVSESLAATGIAGHIKGACFPVGNENHAGVCGQARNLAHIRPCDAIHQGGLAAFQGAEQQHIGLLFADLSHQRFKLVLQVEQVCADRLSGHVGAGLEQSLCTFVQGVEERADDLVEGITELTEQGAHGITLVGCPAHSTLKRATWNGGR